MDFIGNNKHFNNNKANDLNAVDKQNNFVFWKKYIKQLSPSDRDHKINIKNFEILASNDLKINLAINQLTEEHFDIIYSYFPKGTKLYHRVFLPIISTIEDNDMLQSVSNKDNYNSYTTYIIIPNYYKDRKWFITNNVILFVRRIIYILFLIYILICLTNDGNLIDILNNIINNHTSILYVFYNLLVNNK
jgi:hypothetical protein